jgi:hypothetical protein
MDPLDLNPPSWFPMTGFWSGHPNGFWSPATEPSCSVPVSWAMANFRSLKTCDPSKNPEDLQDHYWQPRQFWGNKWENYGNIKTADLWVFFTIRSLHESLKRFLQPIVETDQIHQIRLLRPKDMAAERSCKADVNWGFTWCKVLRFLSDFRHWMQLTKGEFSAC